MINNKITEEAEEVKCASIDTIVFGWDDSVIFQFHPMSWIGIEP